MTKWWVWREDPGWIAYSQEYPCATRGGDPLTLGEPIISHSSASNIRHLAIQSGKKVEFRRAEPRL